MDFFILLNAHLSLYTKRICLKTVLLFAIINHHKQVVACFLKSNLIPLGGKL